MAHDDDELTAIFAFLWRKLLLTSGTCDLVLSSATQSLRPKVRVGTLIHRSFKSARFAAHAREVSMSLLLVIGTTI